MYQATSHPYSLCKQEFASLLDKSVQWKILGLHCSKNSVGCERKGKLHLLNSHEIKSGTCVLLCTVCLSSKIILLFLGKLLFRLGLLYNSVHVLIGTYRCAGVSCSRFYHIVGMHHYIWVGILLFALPLLFPPYLHVFLILHLKQYPILQESG